MIINNKTYTIPELNFNAICKLEDMGIALTNMDKMILSTVRGFLALCMNGDFEKAGSELEAHLENGGSLDEILQEINNAVEQSGFFQALNKTAKKEA